MEIFNGGLPTIELIQRWNTKAVESNYGALVPFIGIVRDDNRVEGLSFDLYESLLDSWFSNWREKIALAGGELFMAHSRGDVKVKESSFICAIASKHREVSLKYIALFVEDFKASAPIWKYDLKEGERMYAHDRSKPLDGSGLLVHDND